MDYKLSNLFCALNGSFYNNYQNYYQPVASKIKFSFSSEEYYNALNNFAKEGQINSILKIIIHEYFHFFQRCYTSFGYYNHLLEQYRHAISMNLVSYIVNHYGIYPINKPIIHIIETNKKLIEDDFITQHLFTWLESILLSSYLNDDFCSYNSNYNSLLEIRSDLPYIAHKFNRLDKQLGSYLHVSKRVRYLDKYNFQPSAENEFCKFEHELINNLRQANNLFSTRSLMESFSKAAELVLDYSHLGFESLYIHLETNSDSLYYKPIFEATKYLTNKTTIEFLNTYLAICDIALSPPIIPLLSKLRHKQLSLECIEPSYRFFSLLNHAFLVPPIASFEKDYKPFAKLICDILCWASPLDIAKFSLDAYQKFDDDIYTWLFLSSQSIRTSSKVHYLDIKNFLLLLNKEKVYCPFTELTDGVLVNHFLNSEIAYTEVYCIFQYLNMQMGRKIMTEFPKELFFPYSVGETAKEVYSQKFIDSYIQLFNLDLKNIRIINPL